MSQQTPSQHDLHQTEVDRAYVDQLFDEYCGDRAASLAPERLHAARALFGEIMWDEGIEALTPGRLDCILDFAAETQPAVTLPNAA